MSGKEAQNAQPAEVSIASHAFALSLMLVLLAQSYRSSPVDRAQTYRCLVTAAYYCNTSIDSHAAVLHNKGTEHDLLVVCTNRAQ